MEVIRTKGTRINSFLLIGSGIMVLLASLYVYLYVLQGVFGANVISENLSRTGALFNLFGEEPLTVAILYSKTTESTLLAEGSTYLADNITTWKKTLNQYHINYVVLQDSDIERGTHFKYKMLLLPGSKALSDIQIDQIKRYIDKGGSVLATSGIASYSNLGKWRGWDFFSEVFGLKFTKEVTREEIKKVNFLRGGLPITSGIPAGYPMKIATWDLPICVEVLEPRTTQVSYWYNYRVEDGLVLEGVKKTAGIAYGTYGKGRFVWWGFEINSVLGAQEDFVYFDRLTRNSVNWLLYLPIGFVKDWPGGYESAAMIVPTVGEKPENLNTLLTILKAKGVKGNFFIEPAKADANPELVRKLASYGDIGTIEDIGYLESVNDTINKLDDYDSQFKKLKSSKDKLSALGNTLATGLLPKFGLFDESSVRALVDNGYKFVLTDSVMDRSVPKQLIRGEKSILTFCKTTRDDAHVINTLGLTQPEFQLYTYKEDADRVKFEGGLYVLKISSDIQCTPANVYVVADLIDYLKSQKIWVASASEIYNWWKERNSIETRIETRSSSRVAVTISNPTDKELSDLTVTVDVQLQIKNIHISSEIIGTPIPKYSYDPASRIIKLEIKNLKKNESRIFYIDYEKISG